MSHHAEYERGGTGQAAARGADRLDSSIRRTLQQPGVRLGQIGADGREIQDGSDASKRSNEFPARLVPKDDYDNRIAVKQDMIGGGVGSGGTDNKDAIYGNPVQMVMPISERDIDWYEGKRKASNYLQFKEWLHSTIDMSDPVQVALARQNGLLKDHFEQRWDIVKENVHNMMQVAKMKLFGRDRWTEEDYEFLWKLKSGNIILPRGDIWDPKTHQLAPNNEAAIKRGLFNVARWVGSTWGGRYLRKSQDPFPDIPNVLQSPTFGADSGGMQGGNTSFGGMYPSPNVWPRFAGRDPGRQTSLSAPVA